MTMRTRRRTSRSTERTLTTTLTMTSVMANKMVKMSCLPGICHCKVRHAHTTLTSHVNVFDDVYMHAAVMVKTVTTPEQVLVVPVIKTSIMPGAAFFASYLIT